MSTPVLTQEQQRTTLSAKKGPVKGLRNVLAQPYDTYWPVLKNDEGGELEKQLRELMLLSKEPQSSIMWSQLQKMKKKERLLVKKTSHENIRISALKKSFITGVNAVTRGLERNDICFVLLDSNIEPIVVKHIITMTKNENIPVILIPFLKMIILETLGFKSAAFALKNDVKNSMDHHFYALYKKISEISTTFIPTNLLVQSFPKKVLRDETIGSDPVASLNRKNFKISSNFYLCRSSTRERIFVPEGLYSTIISSPLPRDWDDFVPLMNDPSLDSSSDVILSKKIEKIRAKTGRCMDFCEQIGDMNEKLSVTNGIEKAEMRNKMDIKRCTTAVLSYIPLKVKRMQGNSSRMKATKAPKFKKK